MTKVEAILQQANGLSPAERKRGLAAWSEATQAEDWSMFNPDTHRNGGRSRP